MTKADPGDLELAIQDAEHAFRLLEFAIRLMNYVELDQIDLNTFGQDTTILLEQENVTLNDRYFASRDNTVLTSQMAVGAMFGASAIALDNVVETTGRDRDPESAAEIDQLWMVIYAIRNAFAHGIANPIWVVKGAYRREIEINLDGDTLRIDLTNLDGRPFEYNQFGGLGNWHRIKNRVLDLVHKEEQGVSS